MKPLESARRRTVVHSHVQFNVVDRARCSSVALHFSQLTLRDGQSVVPAWVEVRELVDSVEYISDKLLEEQSRRDADPAAKIAGDSSSQDFQVCVIAD